MERVWDQDQTQENKLRTSTRLGGVIIHDSTVRRKLLDYERKTIGSQKNQHLTDRMMKLKLIRTRKYASWTAKDWRKMLLGRKILRLMLTRPSNIL